MSFLGGGKARSTSVAETLVNICVSRRCLYGHRGHPGPALIAGRKNMPGQVLFLRIQDRLHAAVPSRIAAGILFIWLSSLFDYYLTVYQVAHGAIELNPLLAPFFNNHQYLLALATKMFLTFPGICILSVFYNRPAAKRTFPMIIVVYSVLLVYHAINLMG